MSIFGKFFLQLREDLNSNRMQIFKLFSDYQKYILRRIISMSTIAIYINTSLHNYYYKEDIFSEPILLLR